MKDQYTHITIVVDRSGSMNVVRTDAEGAINHFLGEQKLVDGECSLLLTDFDSQEPFRVVHDGPITDSNRYRMEPRASTPLLDAVAQAIIATGDRLGAMAEENRPGKVIFVIQTDGLENASQEFTWEGVAEMIKRQTDEYNWQFIFLGMGFDTFKQGERLGVQNVVRSAGTAATYDSTHSVLSASTSAYRGGTVNDMTSMRGVTVNSMGQIFNEAGEEVDPKTGKVITA